MQTTATAARAGGRRAAGTTLGVFGSYEEARDAVDALARAGFPVERVSIVARGLELVERVARRGPRAGWVGRVALAGAALGAVFGFLVGALQTPFSGVPLALWGAALGLVAGAPLGWLWRAESALAPVRGVRARQFELTVDDPSLAARAAELLAGLRVR